MQPEEETLSATARLSAGRLSTLAGQASRREKAIGVALGSLSVLLFSSFTLASRMGFSSSLSWPDLAALRFGIGGALLLPILLRRRFDGVTLRDAACLALFGGLGFALLAYGGFLLAPAAHAAVLLHGTLPLFTFAISALAAPAIIGAYRPLGLVLIGIGVVLMAFDSLIGAGPPQLLGDALLMLASASWSAYGVLLRRLNMNAAHAAALVAVISMICFIPAYAIVRGTALFSIEPRELLAQALVQGVLIGTISIFVYTRAVAALGPATMALFTAAVPSVTVVAAIPLLSETPSVFEMCGITIVTLGVIVTQRVRLDRLPSLGSN